MLGRSAYHTPWLLHELDAAMHSTNVASKRDKLEQYTSYVEEQLNQGQRLHNMTRHILGLFHGEKGAKGWRRELSTQAVNKSAGTKVIYDALQYIEA